MKLRCDKGCVMVESMILSVSQSLLRTIVESQPLNCDALSYELMKFNGVWVSYV